MDRALYLIKNFFSALIRLQLTVVGLVWLSTANAGNLWTEKLLGDELTEKLDSDQVIWLENKNWPLFSIYTKSPKKDVQGGIILLHEIGTHPDWPQVISPLRTALPKHGWHTLSVMMPSYDEDTTESERFKWLYIDSESRLDAAIGFFLQRNIKNIVIVGHGHSASLALHYLTRSKSDVTAISALVGIGITTRQDRPDTWLDAVSNLEKLPISILDIFAERDRRDVKNGAPSRLSAAHIAGQIESDPIQIDRTQKVRLLAVNKTGNPRFRQKEIAGADHYFTRHSSELVSYIKGWLNVYAAGMRISEN